MSGPRRLLSTVTVPLSKRQRRPGPLGGSGFALAGSVLLHASLLAGGAWLLARSLRSSPAPTVVSVVQPPVELDDDVALPEVEAAGPESDQPSSLPAPLEIAMGGRHAPRPDLE